MEANNSTAVYERAVRSIRRLAELAGDSDREVVRAALVRELRDLLELDSMAVIGDEGGPAQPRAITPATGTDSMRPEARSLELVEDPGRSLVLQLRSAAGSQEAVIMVAGEQRALDADELAVAAALIDVAAVVLGLTRSRRTRSPVSCLMLDVDELKQINDTFGHLEGDRVLRELGSTLRSELRAYDLAARYGGDEFLILLPATDKHQAEQVAARMRAAAARITSPAHRPARTPISVTCGAATSRHGDALDTLLERADQALLGAKHHTHGPAAIKPGA